MKRIPIVLLLLLLVILPAAGASAADPGPREFAEVQRGFTGSGETVLPWAPDRIIIKLRKSSLEDPGLRPGLTSGTGPAVAETGIPSLDALALEMGVEAVARAYAQPRNRLLAEQLGVGRWFTVTLAAPGDIPALVERYRADPNVEHASPDWRAFPAVVPSDPLYADHWGHNNTAQLPGYDWGGTWDHTGPPVGTVGFDANAQAAWDAAQGFGSSTVIVAILDSGVDIDHPDLSLVAGYDFGDNDSNPDDNSSSAGHGTCCAGVAASLVNNSRGACGIAPGCRIMPCKVANSAGSMYFSAIQNALYWAADNGADIISMSLGAAISSDPATDTALQYAYNAGVVILAATGNENKSTISYPAINSYVIGIGAASPCGDRKRSSSNSSECNPGVYTDPNGYTCDGERWWGSNYGSTSKDAAGAVDVIAPTILPTTDIAGSGGYRSGDYEPFFNGTSCATPYAAGVCALIKSANPTWTPAQIRSQLVSTAIDIVNVESGSGWDRYSGYGMVDAAAAVGGGGPVAPVAAFSGSPTSGYEPLDVSFTDASSGSPTSWSWDFGDGGTSTAQNPSHIYASAGSYTVTLTVANAAGSDDEVKANYITVTTPPPPVAQFAGSPTSGEAPLAVTFTDQSTNNPTSWSWDFGDGGNSTAQNPTYVYNSVGTYTVSLTAANAYGSDVETKTGYITVTEPGVAQKSYALSETTVAGTVSGGYAATHASDNVRESITEILSSNHPRKKTSYLDHRWTFSVPSGSSAPSFYLEGYRPSNPDGDDFVFACSTDGSAWTNLVTIASATEQVYSASLPVGTSGTVYIRVLDTDGSWDRVSLDAIYVDEMYIQTESAAGPPTADFSGSPTAGYAPLSVQFTDLSAGAPTTWSWDFGDGGTSTAQNPSHAYTSAGTYTVTLTAANAYGSDVEQKAGYVTVSEMTGSSVHVADIVVTRKTAGPNQFAQAYVTVHDQAGSPVSGAVVYGFFNFPNAAIYSAQTGTDGVAFIEGGKAQNVGDFCFEATDVVLSGYTYDSAANLVTRSCESGDLFGAGARDLLSAGGTPDALELRQNYPNPFNPITTIAFGRPEAGNVRLDVYTVKGELVETLVDGTRGAGYHTVEWNAAGVSSGIYLYRLITPRSVLTRKMILLR
ncbi:MAG: PKD domain-containing protein [Candidatus Krumholzibacteria bacterium]|nr:PKD domain-containing protein [Candidatus Krumholzibacteria bacterium]